MSSRRFINKPRKYHSMDLTPLIDVVFLLLIFFMVATNFSKFSSMDIKVPKSTVENKNTAIETIEVLLNSNKILNIRITTNGIVENQEVVENNLNQKINDLLKASNNKNIILIADEVLDYGYIIKVMSILKEAGVEGISLKTEN
ncbi:MAG: biopolymer transporter ExbD [Fusobacteriaceae bacterium]|nr:biopolymer transporter ExbD [Fusobacteriaceae bacterium]MBP6466833.1 biopolymer transporter ExbD [Fusobacteriaceae bacterium]MBP9595161.1 biopolymer transporter ExbD [Fusobacteriaceae bacterium]MBU9918653.1 biopolymer transporter ExbD [Fusobacteriaceae bacterium]